MNTQRVYNAAIDMVDRNVAEGRGAKTAFIDPARRITYGELADGCARVAPMLVKLGLAREDRIAMMMLDTVDFPVLFWGAIRAGIIPVPLNTLLTADQYRYILEDSRAKVLFVSAPLLAVAQQAAAGIASLKTIVVVAMRPAICRVSTNCSRPRRPVRSPCRPRPMTWRSGSIRPPPPPCRRACAMCIRAQWRPRGSMRRTCSASARMTSSILPPSFSSPTGSA